MLLVELLSCYLEWDIIRTGTFIRCQTLRGELIWNGPHQRDCSFLTTAIINCFLFLKKKKPVNIISI